MSNQDNNITTSIFDRLPSSDSYSDKELPNYNYSEDTPRNVKPIRYQNDDEDKPWSRPLSISIIAWMFVASLVIEAFQFIGYLKDAKLYPVWFWPLYLISFGLLITATNGLFGMKKYGMWVLLAEAILSTAVGLTVAGVSTRNSVAYFRNSSIANSMAGVTLVTAIVFWIVIFALVFRKYDQMD